MDGNSEHRLRSSPVLKAAVQRLRELALAARPGDFLGSEEELRELLSISRPTYRQAVLLVEQDQLITKRMGLRGGCYASRPSPQSVSRQAALYLQVENATLRDLIDVSHGLRDQVLVMASASQDARAQAGLRQFVDELRRESRPDDDAWFLEHERRLEHHFLALAHNPALQLFLQIARKYVDDNPASAVLIANSALRRLRVSAWERMSEAVLAGDADEALAISRQQHRTYLSLLSDEALRGNALAPAAHE